jgi:hypothetical protein
MARKKIENEYNLLIDYLQKLFPEKYNQIQKIYDEHLKYIRQNDTNVDPNSDKTSIFPGLNLRSYEICDKTFRHNYPLGVNLRETHLINYLNANYMCRIDGCGKQFYFDKYISLYQCYYSLNGEPYQSTGGNVVNYMVEKDVVISIRSFETFNFYVGSKLLFSIQFPKSNSVSEFKEFVEKNYGFKILSLYGYNQYSQIPKLMKDDDNFNCTQGNEFKIDLSQNLSIMNLNNSLTEIKSFKANISLNS